MRKIETAMVAALRARRAWRERNTAVILDKRQDGKPLAIVELYGNHIATVGYAELLGAAAGPAHAVVSISVSLAGWNTATTRSRLSAIVREFAQCAPVGLGVGTNDGQPALHDTNGCRDIDANGWYDVALTKG